MAVRDIENIIIPGFERYSLYSFDYTPGFADSPGSVEVEFLDKSGVYEDINVGIHAYFPILIKNSTGEQRSIGEYTLVSTTIREDNRAKILSVKFLDRSVELDRVYVAVRGQVGYDQEEYNRISAKEKPRISGIAPSFGRIAWIGSSDEACRENLAGAAQGTDPCDPCEERTTFPAYRQLACDQYYLNNKRVYTYTFDELVSTVGRYTGITMRHIGGPASYTFDYSGTARDVLNNICGELGLTFFYDPVSNLLIFVDVKVGIPINTKNIESESNKCKILSKSITKSREGSKDVWGVAGFSREGEERRYACGLNSCRKLVLQPFTLEDILLNPAHFQENEGLPGFRRLEFYSVINSRIGKNFRDLFVWIQEYAIKGPQELEALKFSVTSKPLVKLNGMKIHKVFHPGASDVQDQSMYRLLMRLHTSKDFDTIKDKAGKNKSYFFLAEIDDIYENKINSFETSIANNFLGQYWLRYFKEHWTGLSYSTISPDGNVRYYDYNEPINLPFSDIIYDAYSSLSASPLLSGKGNAIAGGSTGDLKARDTFFLMQRPGSYWPPSIEDDTLQTIEDTTNKYLFKEMTTPVEIINNFTKDAGLPNYDQTKYKIFVVEHSADDLNLKLTIADDVDHPGEQPNVIMNVNACGKYTSYGLRSAKCRRFDISMTGASFSIFMPVQGHAQNRNHSGYTILVERQGTDANYFIPKAEVFSYGPPPASNSLSIDLNFYNATKNDLELLAKNSGGRICDTRISHISSLLKQFDPILSYNVGAKEEREYTLEGFPDDFFTAADGITSFSVTAGESGLTTTLSFSNTAPFQQNVDSFLKKLRYIQLRQFSHNFPSGSYNLSNASDLPTIS